VPVAVITDLERQGFFGPNCLCRLTISFFRVGRYYPNRLFEARYLMGRAACHAECPSSFSFGLISG